LRVISVKMRAETMPFINAVRLAVYMMNKIGPMTEPCGTPQMS